MPYPLGHIANIACNRSRTVVGKCCINTYSQKTPRCTRRPLYPTQRGIELNCLAQEKLSTATVNMKSLLCMEGRPVQHIYGWCAHIIYIYIYRQLQPRDVRDVQTIIYIYILHHIAECANDTTSHTVSARASHVDQRIPLIQ